jgi:hypothetical protein
MTLGRKLQSPKVVALQAIEPHQGRRHAGTAQHLREGPKLVGLVFRPDHKQLRRFDSHPHGRRRIKRLRPIEHDEASAFTTSFTGNHQSETLDSAPFFSRQPFDKASAAKSAVGQQSIELAATAGHQRSLAHPPAILQMRNLAAEIFNELG